MTKEGYIQLVAPLAVAACLRFGGYLPSVLIAQACLEPGFGVGSGHELYTEANNCLGMKTDLINSTWTSDYWHGDTHEKYTPEVYNGVPVTVWASFRKYRSLDDCFYDYVQFMRDVKSGGRYKYRDVLKITDPRALITQVSKRGYATGPSYIESVMGIVNDYNLTQYDVGVKTMVTIGSARIDENGNISGGQAGDNNGLEVSTQPYYDHPKGWYIFRAKSVFVRELIADGMAAACANDNIGYSQPHNQSLYSLAKKVDFDLSKVTTPCETDCARLVRCCILYSGIQIKDFYTGDEPGVLSDSGYFDQVYVKSQEDLARGDILVTKSKGHTVIVLNSGSNYRLSVREMQECLRALGWYTGSIDGDYGPQSMTAVRNYQKGWRGKLEVDGVFGPKTSLKLVDDYVFYMAGRRNKTVPFTKEEWLKKMDEVADYAFSLDPHGSKGLMLYGDNTCFPIGRTMTWSCDRLPAAVAYELGLTDQRADFGGSHGWLTKDWIKLTEKGLADKIDRVEDLQAGDIVVIRTPSDPTFHTFVMASDYGPVISKWDFGWDTKIEREQPYKSGIIEEAWKSQNKSVNYGIRWRYKKSEKKYTPIQTLVAYGQAESIKFTGHPIEIDGVRGFETNRQMVRCLQHAANLDWGSDLKIDGDLGPLTRKAFEGHYVRKGETQYVVTAVQIIAYCKGLDPKGVEYPGHFGDGLKNAINDAWLSDVEIFKLLK